MKGKTSTERKSVALLLALALLAAPIQADIFSTISNGISSAANSVGSGLSTAASATSSGLSTATNAVGSGLSTATNAVGSGLSTAVNATTSGLSTAANATGRWVNTAVGGVKDAYNVSSTAVRNYTSDVKNALAPAADNVRNSAEQLGGNIYNASTGTYQGVVDVARNVTGQNASPAPTSSQTTTVDTTLASSILRTLLANSTGYIQVANSLLVALGQNQSQGVETGIRNIVNNSTGNMSYPTYPVNDTVSLGLAQAIVTSLITANNYTVTVEYQGRNNRVNASEVANVFIAGLQDGLTPCARNISTRTNATSGSSDYFQTISQNCCYLVAQPLTYTEALSQTNGVASIFEASLANSQNLGQAPSLDLTRCLTNTTSVS